MDCKEENEKLKAKADDAKNLAEQAAPIFGENCWVNGFQHATPKNQDQTWRTMWL